MIATDKLIKAQAVYITVLEGQVKEVEGELDSLKTETDKRIETLKAELNAANEALLDQAGSTDMLIIERVQAYNYDLEPGEVEMLYVEMAEHMADKITVPVTAAA